MGKEKTTSLDIAVKILKAFVKLKANEVKALELGDEKLELRIFIGAMLTKMEDMEDYFEDVGYMMEGWEKGK